VVPQNRLGLVQGEVTAYTGQAILPPEETTMTAEDIRNAAMAKRTTQGVKICLLTPDGETTLYPKDHATKQAWLKDAQRKGYQILEA
jgi:hypothetical protein